MEMSHVADDYAAIARRLKEIRAEQELAEQRAAMPPRRPTLNDAMAPPSRVAHEGFRVAAR